MTNWRLALLTGSLLAGAQFGAGFAAAENKMGYQLESTENAATLPRAGGSLGMRVGPKERITSEGLTFDVLKVEAVQPGSAAAQAGLKVDDQIIAVNGRVFPTVAAFAGYVGSVKPGQQIQVDYMPAGGGPQQAQRLGVTVGEAGRAAPPQKDGKPENGGLSTGAKIAIGIGAAAVFGCYKYNCYERLKAKYEEERKKHGGAPAEPQPQPR